MGNNYQIYLDSLQKVDKDIKLARYALRLKPFFFEIKEVILANQTLLSNFKGIVAELETFTNRSFAEIQENELKNLAQNIAFHFQQMSEIQNQIVQLDHMKFASEQIQHTFLNLKNFCYNRMTLNEIQQSLNLLLVSKEANAQQKLQSQIQHLQSDLQVCQNTCHNLQQENSLLKTSIQTQNEKINHLQTQNANLQTKTNSLSGELKNKFAEVTQLQDSIQTLEKVKEKLQQENLHFKNELQTISQKLAEKTSLIQTLEKQTKELKIEMQELKSAHQTEIKNLNTQFYQENYVRLKNEQEKYEKEINQLKTEVKSLETEKRNLQALINTNNITNDKIQGANIQLQNLTNQLSYLQKEVVNYQSRIPSFVSYEKMLSETNNLQNSILDLKKQYSQLISDIDTTRKNYERTKKLYDEALSKKYEIEHYKKEIEKDKILMKFMEFASTNNYSYSATHQSLSSISKEFRKICDDFSHTVYILFRDGIIDNDNALNFLELKNLSKNLSEFNKSSFLSKLNHLDLPSKKHIERLNEGVQTIVIDANKCIAELKNLKPELKKLNDKLTKYFL